MLVPWVAWGMKRRIFGGGGPQNIPCQFFKMLLLMRNQSLNLLHGAASLEPSHDSTHSSSFEIREERSSLACFICSELLPGQKNSWFEQDVSQTEGKPRKIHHKPTATDGMLKEVQDPGICLGQTASVSHTSTCSGPNSCATCSAL